MLSFSKDVKSENVSSKIKSNEFPYNHKSFSLLKPLKCALKILLIAQWYAVKSIKSGNDLLSSSGKCLIFLFPEKRSPVTAVPLFEIVVSGCWIDVESLTLHVIVQVCISPQYLCSTFSHGTSPASTNKSKVFINKIRTKIDL